MVDLACCSLVLVLLGRALLSGSMPERTLTTYVSGSASAIEPDQQQAEQEAEQKANHNATQRCTGNVTAISVGSSNCIRLGSSNHRTSAYTCMATLQATCEIPFQGR